MKWVKREVVELYEWSPTFDFDSFQTALESAIQESTFGSLRSGVICNYNAQSTILKSVSCACEFGESIDESDLQSCFPQQDVNPGGEGLACIGLASRIQV